MGRGEDHAFLVYVLTFEVVETLRKRRLKLCFQVNMRLFSDERLCNSQCIEGDKKESGMRLVKVPPFASSMRP